MINDKNNYQGKYFLKTFNFMQTYELSLALSLSLSLSHTHTHTHTQIDR